MPLLLLLVLGLPSHHFLLIPPTNSNISLPSLFRFSGNPVGGSRKLVLAVGSKFFQFSQRLNSDKKLIEIGFLQSKYAFLENAIFGLYSDQNGENHGVVRCCL